MATFTLSQSAWEFANRVPYVPCVPTSHFHVPMCQKTCQRAKGVPIFQTVSIIYYYIKISTGYHSYTYDMYMYRNKNCVILRFYTSCRVKVFLYYRIIKCIFVF